MKFDICSDVHWCCFGSLNRLPFAYRATMPESGARVGSPTRARYQLRYFGNDMFGASKILVLESTIGCL